ncbi:hypothetical protein SUGI_0004530 [Cryptomeria japonica]|nr:hypothetical protein SUGI_0004530 [Cryptomeria japonica]
MIGHGLESLLLCFNASPNPISCVIYDSFLPWVPKIVAKLSIIHTFWTQSITVFALYYHFETIERWDGERKLPETIDVLCLGEFKIGDLRGPFHQDQELKARKVLDYFEDLESRNPEDTRVAAGSDPWEESKGTIRWLDSKPTLSVHYVSFGSITYVSPVQIRDLAAGLDRSQESFLWVIRPP